MIRVGNYASIASEILVRFSCAMICASPEPNCIKYMYLNHLTDHQLVWRNSHGTSRRHRFPLPDVSKQMMMISMNGSFPDDDENK